MPLSYDQISAITQKKFIPKLYDNIFDSNPLLQRMKKKGRGYEKIDGGERIVVPLGYSLASAAGWYSGADTLSVVDNETITAAEYTWKQFYASIMVTRADELKNSGDSQILNFVKTKVKIAEKTVQDYLGHGIYSAGTDAKAVVGLRVGLSGNSIVGGISQTNYSWWQPQLDSTTTTLSVATMQERDNACTVDSDTPTVIVTTRSLLNSYHGLLQPQQRFTDKETASGGFASVMFAGKPVIADSKCPSGNMFFLNEEYLGYVVHEKEDCRFEEFQKPHNQNVKIAKIYWMGAFTFSNNRLQGRLSALTA